MFAVYHRNQKKSRAQRGLTKMKTQLRMHGKEWMQEVVTVLAGTVLFAMAYQLFLLPGGVIIGGFTGIATLLNMLFAFPSGIVIFLLNLPFLLINLKLYGWRFCAKTLVGVLLTSFAVDYLNIFPQTVTDPLLCAIGGGLVMGIGCGLLFSKGYTTGGSDLIAWILHKICPRISTGTFIFIADCTTVLISAIVLKSFETAFYAIVAGFIFSKMIDLTVAGIGKSKMVLIFSEKYREITDEILNRMERGVTLLQGSGAYTNAPRQIILCAVRPAELYQLKRITKEHDENAFFLICDATEVFGEGFQSIYKI